MFGIVSYVLSNVDMGTTKQNYTFVHWGGGGISQSSSEKTQICIKLYQMATTLQRKTIKKQYIGLYPFRIY